MGYIISFFISPQNDLIPEGKSQEICSFEEFVLNFRQIRFYIYFYRPQTKFAKVMFSQVSVCPQVGGLPHCILGYTSRPTSPCAVHAGIWSTSGRYASHWNAFLLFKILHKTMSAVQSVLFERYVNVCFCWRVNVF